MSLYLVAPNGRHVKRLASCGSCGWYWGSRLAWSPDGRWIAVARGDNSAGTVSLWIVAASGGRLHRLTFANHCLEWCADVHPTWSPNGHLLLYERPTSTLPAIYTIRPDGSDRQKIAVGDDAQWSPSGRRIAFWDYGGIEIANADGSGVHLLFAQTESDNLGAPSWSPDGKKLVFFDLAGDQQGSAFSGEVWTINTDGSAEKRLYTSGCCLGESADPIWSPDGQMVAFSASTDKAGGGTFVINADGSGLRQLSPNVPGYDTNLSWQRRPDDKASSEPTVLPS